MNRIQFLVGYILLFFPKPHPQQPTWSNQTIYPIRNRKQSINNIWLHLLDSFRSPLFFIDNLPLNLPFLAYKTPMFLLTSLGTKKMCGITLKEWGILTREMEEESWIQLSTYGRILLRFRNKP